MNLTRDETLIALSFAARAPSAHNIQPARWRVHDGRIELLEHTTRWLAIGDPTGRDNQIGLGMAWEAMQLGLSTLGYSLALPSVEAIDYPVRPGSVRMAAAADLIHQQVEDPLARQVKPRKSWRGVFPAATSEVLGPLDAYLAAQGDVIVLDEPGAIEQLAIWYDQASAEVLADPNFAQELYGWMRFSERHPRWVADGLAADCMALSAFEAKAAKWAMHPKVLPWLNRFGLTRALVSESSKVRSATRVVLLHACASQSYFETGRRWLRFWLGLTRLDCSAVPMSALVDSPTLSEQLLRQYPVPAGRRLVNVMRIGPTPRTPVPESARLPVSELLLE